MYEVCTDNEWTHFLMEYVPNGSLFDELKNLLRLEWYERDNIASKVRISTLEKIRKFKKHF